QIGIAEQQRAWAHGLLRQRQRLTLATVRQADDPGARRPSALSGGVAGSLVRDHDHGVGGGVPERAHRRARPPLPLPGGRDGGGGWGGGGLSPARPPGGS